MAQKIFKTANNGLRVGDRILKNIDGVDPIGSTIMIISGSLTIHEPVTNFEQENGDPWESSHAIATYIDENFSNGGADGVGSEDVANIVLTTQAAYDALDPKVSTTLYLIPE